MNVIIVMLDTLRPDHLGCYGNKWIKTPHFDEFAKESFIFDRAFAESLPTIQVRRAMMTGMRCFPFTKGFYSVIRNDIAARGAISAVPVTILPGWEPIPWDQVTMAEFFQGWQSTQTIHTARFDQAYRTAFITDTAPYFFTPGMNFHRGFAHWEYIRGQETDSYGVLVKANKYDLKHFVPPWMERTWEGISLPRYLANTADWETEEDHFAPQVFRRAIKWLEESREAKDPFFLLVDSFDPHEPWDPPQHYVDLYDPGYEGVQMISPYYGPTDEMTEAELKHMRALYAGEVTMVDAWFGKFMDKVRELDLLDNTLIIVTSDHGHLLGEKGVAGKIPGAMYNELNNFVLMIRHPQGIGAGQRSDAFVQHQDVFSTVLNAVGITPPYEVDGKDLMPIMEGKAHRVRDCATCGFLLHVWVHDGDYVLISRNTGDQPQLYDMRNDPEQYQNIAVDNPHIVKRLFDLALEDAGGPILPDWEVDPNLPVVNIMVGWSRTEAGRFSGAEQRMAALKGKAPGQA